jgi:hypothetical protein
MYFTDYQVCFQNNRGLLTTDVCKICSISAIHLFILTFTFNPVIWNREIRLFLLISYIMVHIMFSISRDTTSNGTGALFLDRLLGHYKIKDQFNSLVFSWPVCIDCLEEIATNEVSALCHPVCTDGNEDFTRLPLKYFCLVLWFEKLFVYYISSQTCSEIIFSSRGEDGKQAISCSITKILEK